MLSRIISSITASVFGECVSHVQALCISTSMRECKAILSVNKIKNNCAAGKLVPAIKVLTTMARLIPNQGMTGYRVIINT